MVKNNKKWLAEKKDKEDKKKGGIIMNKLHINKIKASWKMYPLRDLCFTKKAFSLRRRALKKQKPAWRRKFLRYWQRRKIRGRLHITRYKPYKAYKAYNNWSYLRESWNFQYPFSRKKRYRLRIQKLYRESKTFGIRRDHFVRCFTYKRFFRWCIPKMTDKKYIKLKHKEKRRRIGNNFLDKFSTRLECRLDNFAVKLRFYPAIVLAYQDILHRGIFVNLKLKKCPTYTVKPFQLVTRYHWSDFKGFAGKENQLNLWRNTYNTGRNARWAKIDSTIYLYYKKLPIFFEYSVKLKTGLMIFEPKKKQYCKNKFLSKSSLGLLIYKFF